MTDYIIYRKDFSLRDARTAPAVEVPEQVIEGQVLCGAARGPVEAYDFPTGRGLRTTKRVKAGEIVLSVPLERCWSASSARESPELKGFEALPDEDVLALHLLIERKKGPKGKNAEHLESLPKSFDMPVFWSKEELAELDEELQGTAQKLAAQVEGDFANVVGVAADAARSNLSGSVLDCYDIDLAAYRWAKAALWSRSTDLKAKGEDAKRYLVPGFDLANHDPLLPVCHGIKDGQVFIRATQDMDIGEEVKINYGAHLNNHLLLWYGFVLDENPFEGTTLEFPVDRSEADHLKLMGATLREDDTNKGKVFAQCTISFLFPLPDAMVASAAVCNGICKPGQKQLEPAQEVQALDMLAKIIPSNSCPPLPPASNYRRRCAAVAKTTNDRMFAAFHAALQKRRKALVPKKK